MMMMATVKELSCVACVIQYLARRASTRAERTDGRTQSHLSPVRAEYHLLRGLTTCKQASFVYTGA